MEYLKSLFAFVLLFSAFSASASQEETFGTFSLRLDSWADGLNGVVVSAGDKSADIDMGKNSGLVKGMVFNVTRPGEELVHPVTGESLGRKTVALGRLTVESIYDKYSSASYEGADELKPGDNVSFEIPVPVKLVFEGLTDGEKADASYAVLKSGRFSESGASDYTVSCTKTSPEVSEASCALIFKDGAKIITAEIPVSSVVITAAFNTVKKSGASSGDGGGKVFPNRFVSAAAGFALGRDGGLTVAAAERRAVTVYTFSAGGGFKENHVIADGFDEIVNVELADVNGNGADELLISNIGDEGRVESYIYEYSGGVFRPVVSKTGYLFRTFYSGGKKTVICQQFTGGDFTGPIAAYVYKDGLYSAGDAYGGTLGARLYGFGETSVGEMSFNSNGSLMVKSPERETSSYNGYFGDTPHKLKYTKQVLKGITKDKDGMETNDVENRVVAVSVYQRIIEITKGKFLLAGNVPVERMAMGEDDYKSSFYGIYILFGGKAEPFWDTPYTRPSIAEMDLAASGGETYILILKNFKSGFFGGSASSIKIIAADVK